MTILASLISRILCILPFFIVCLFHAHAQVRLIQISDTHSSLETIGRQVNIIDVLGRDFLAQNPNGEVVVYVIGDFTSINSFSRADGGWLSYEALALLKELGYTVIFSPGNHGALDWSGRIDGAALFLQQMAALHEWGIPILASNIFEPTKPFKKYLSSSYELKTLKIPTHIVGMTLDILLQKSNLSEQSSKRLFKKILGYEDALRDLWPKLQDQGVQNVILGVHDSHLKMAGLAKSGVLNNLSQSRKLSDPRVTHLMAADDHLVAAYKKNGVLITDGGAYGSLNVIDYDDRGVRPGPVVHYAIDQNSLREIDPKIFKGHMQLNTADLTIGETDPRIWNYAQKVEEHLNSVRRQKDRVLVETKGFDSHKMQMKLRRTTLGSVYTESLVLWAEDKLNYRQAGDNLVLQSNSTPIIAVANSSSYRRESPIPAGPLTELEVEDMYPYLNEATLYEFSGEQISALIYAIKATYAKEDSSRFTPQMSFNVRDNKGVLEVYHNGGWAKIKNKHMYKLAIDGWLSNHRFGLGFRDKLWSKLLSENTPIATEEFQAILVQYLGKAIKQNESLQCFRFLQHGDIN